MPLRALAATLAAVAVVTLAGAVVPGGAAGADEHELVRGLVARHAADEPALASRATIAETSLTRTDDLRLAAPDGRTWRYFVRAPRRGDARGLAAVLVLAGIETGRESLAYVAERDDMVLLAMDYPFAGAEQLGGWALVGALPELRAAALSTIEGAALGVAHLAGRPDVDPGRITVLGVSFGSIFAIALGAHDPRASAVVAIYGGGDLGRLARRNLRAPWWLPSFLVGPIVRAWFGELEPLSHVAWIAPRRFLMAASTEDEMFPPSSARELFERAGEPKQILWYESGHMDLFDPELLRRLTGDVVARLQASGLVGAQPGAARSAAP
ncbi:MAG: alpha/beta hydrolase [Thermodesulfobacteriota bacterium]